VRCDGDVFDPHVTLIGSLAGGAADLAERTRRLAAGLAPYQVTLGPLVARPADPNRYRRLFSAVRRAPAVLAANAAARAAFAVEGGDAYEAHLSLAYTDADAERLADLRDIADRAWITGLAFAVGRLELWRTEGAVHDWRLTETFRLAESAV
jgi:hypothetical protein